MAENKLVVEITMTDAEAESLDAFIDFKCLDKEKYLKNLLARGLRAIVDTWDKRLKKVNRADSTSL